MVISITKELKVKQQQLALAATLEDKLDIAYEIYIETTALLDSLPDGDRQKPNIERLQQNAVRFMKILLNVESDEKMIVLAERRQKMKEYDSRYLPGREPIAKIEVGESESTHLGELAKKSDSANSEEIEEAQKKGRVARYNWKRLASLAVALDQRRIMRVNDSSRHLDKGYRGGRRTRETIFLTPEQRASHRIVIKDGVFYKPKSTTSVEFDRCDTTAMTSHEKPSYAAYTVNAQGEISIFNHHGMADFYAHSSMNSGTSVLAAGEIKIVKGQLREITTHSGHYQPSIENVYRTLKYFQQQGVDISATQIRDFGRPPRDTNISYIQHKTKTHPKIYLKASDVVRWGNKLGLGKLQPSTSTSTFKMNPIEAQRSTVLSLSRKLRGEIDSLIKDLQEHKQAIEGRWKIEDFFRSIHHYFAGKGSYKDMKDSQIRTLDSTIEDLTSLKQSISEQVRVLLSEGSPTIPESLTGMRRELQDRFKEQAKKAIAVETEYGRSDLGLSSHMEKTLIEEDEEEATPEKSGPQI
jgi:hypothetical protein